MRTPDMFFRFFFHIGTISTTSAGLRHKLSKLQLRAPGYPKGPPCIQRGPQKEKKKKRNQKKKKERKEKLKSESRKSLQLPPSNLRTTSTTPPRNRAGKSLQLPPRRIFSFCPFLLFSSLRPPHRLNPALSTTFIFYVFVC